MDRRHCFRATMACGVVMAVAALATWASTTDIARWHALAVGSAGASAQAAFLDMAWEELVPKEWNPLKRFQSLDRSQLDDGDPHTAQLLRDMRSAWDNAPTRLRLDGAHVRLAGYVVPLDAVAGEVREFLLVPYFGACIHSPPPPANQIVHVHLAKARRLRTMDVVRVSGTLHTRRDDSSMGASGYAMDAAGVEPWREPPR